MEISEENLSRTPNAEAFTHRIMDTLAIYCHRKTGENINIRFIISRKDPSVNDQVIKSMKTVATWEDAGNTIDYLCKEYEYACKLAINLKTEPNTLTIVKTIHERIKTNEGVFAKRLKLVSDDNKVQMYVKKEGDYFVARVVDKVKGGTDIKEGFLEPKVPTETEAENIVKASMDFYNSHGYYCRNVGTKRHILEHECIDEDNAPSNVGGSDDVIFESLETDLITDAEIKTLLDATKIIRRLYG